jgi:hypothetical protein
MYIVYSTEITDLENKHGGQVWWCTPINPALSILRLEDCEFKSSLKYIVRLW